MTSSVRVHSTTGRFPPTAAFCVVALVWAVAAAAQGPGSPGTIFVGPGVEVFAAGRYGEDPAYDPLNHGDEVCPPPPFDLVEETREIPAVMGGRFGVEYALPGPEGEVEAVTVRVRHPLWRDPIRGGHSRVETWIAWVCAGRRAYAGWEFTYDWEAQPGPWVMEVLRQEQVVVAVPFLVRAEGGSEDLGYALPGGAGENGDPDGE